MKGIGWRMNIKFRTNMFDTYVQVTDGVKELILFGANQRVEKCQKMPSLGPFLPFRSTAKFNYNENWYRIRKLSHLRKSISQVLSCSLLQKLTFDSP